MQTTVKIFFCYAHEDEALLNKLKTHLKPLQRQGFIDVWSDRNISAGAEWGREIDKHLNTAQIILLLISPDFMASDYCYSIEMKQAIERHERGEAKVIPIILRPVYWQGAPFSKLQTLPTNAKPVASSKWRNWDEAFFDVAESIRKVVEQQNFSIPLRSHNSMGSVQKENQINTSRYSGEYNIKNGGPVQGQVVGDHANVNIYFNSGQNEPKPSQASHYHSIGQDLTDQERLDRAAILTRLRKLYILSHDNTDPGIIAGTDPLPKEWVEEELEKMGEIWRQDIYYVYLDDDLNRAVSVTNATFSASNSGQGSWKGIVTANLKEFVLLWTLIYGKNSEKLIDPFLSELQTKLILVSEQLIRALSWNSRDIPKEVISNIGNIAARLENLGRMQFYIDGGLSVSKFNELGDDIVKDVESLTEQLNSATK